MKELEDRRQVWRVSNADSQKRQTFSGSDETALRKRLRLLAGRGHCEPEAPHRLATSLNGRNALLEGKFPLRNIPQMPLAGLTIELTYNRRTQRLNQSSVVLEGVNADGAGIVVAIHLDPERRGSGACGHALVHCHVGPTWEAVPAVRVPFPSPNPVDALDWILSQLLSDWEPAPWSVLAAQPTP